MNIGPGPRTVYVLRNAEGIPLYVGCTSHPAVRPLSHIHKPWGDDIASVTLHPVPKTADPYDFEMGYINRLRPLHNVDARWREPDPHNEPCHFFRFCGAPATTTRTDRLPRGKRVLPVCDHHAIRAHTRDREWCRVLTAESGDAA